MSDIEIDPSSTRYVYCDYELETRRSDGYTPLESSHGRVGVGTWALQTVCIARFLRRSERIFFCGCCGLEARKKKRRLRPSAAALSSTIYEYYLVRAHGTIDSRKYNITFFWRRIIFSLFPFLTKTIVVDFVSSKYSFLRQIASNNCYGNNYFLSFDVYLER